VSFENPGTSSARPLLSIAMPTRNRPELLERALASVIEATGPLAEQVEIAVSDGSTDEASGTVVQRLLADWPGGYRYVWNRPALSLPGNMNRATGLATGEWILQLHDDDLLRPGAGPTLLDAIGRTAPGERVLLFGVDIVGLDGTVRRTQRFRRERYLAPREALARVLRNSSFVRLPAAVVHRTAFEEEGGFEASLGAACDTDMWMRLFSRYGVRCVPHTSCAYTVHEAATTTGMWNREVIQAALRIFDRAAARGIVPERSIRRWEADFFHQFILGGTYRRLRLRRRAEAREVLGMFDLPAIRDLGVSPKWLPVRAAFVALTAGARRSSMSTSPGERT
jgi:glycosyltransferase involved in cell wall biosynthesis